MQHIKQSKTIRYMEEIIQFDPTQNVMKFYRLYMFANNNLKSKDNGVIVSYSFMSDNPEKIIESRLLSTANILNLSISNNNDKSHSI